MDIRSKYFNHVFFLAGIPIGANPILRLPLFHLNYIRQYRISVEYPNQTSYPASSGLAPRPSALQYC